MAAANASLSRTGLAFFSSLCVGTFSLGCWQSQRYFEKIKMIEKREQDIMMEPKKDLEKDAKCSIDEISSDGSLSVDESVVASSRNDRGIRRILVQGKFCHEKEVLVGPRGPPAAALSETGPNSGRSSGGMSSSPQGYYVLTPFARSKNMGTILINRGWVPSEYVLQKAGWDRPKGVVNIVGVASKTETPRFISPPHNEKEPRQLLWMDRIAIEKLTSTTGASPLFLQETSSATEKNTIIFPVKPSKETVGEFKVSPATHAGYGFTWFGLSGFGVIMTRKLITRGRG